MKRTPLKRIGKRGAINQKYKRLISQMSLPQYCEMRLNGCLGNFALTIAHRKKRIHYRTAEELADPKEFVVACSHCHNIQENNAELTKQLFDRIKEKVCNQYK